eukprot:1729387-Prymnesium_polylepis.1
MRAEKNASRGDNVRAGEVARRQGRSSKGKTEDMCRGLPRGVPPVDGGRRLLSRDRADQRLRIAQ